MKLKNYTSAYCDSKKCPKMFRKYLNAIKIMKIKYKLHCLIGKNHVKFLKKYDVFSELGEKVLYQPDTLPNNPKLIKIHNNVKIASGVIFYEHDVINSVLQTLDSKNNYVDHLGAIEIFDNCFIGGKSIIVGNVKIGPNAIVGAGSVVTKDVEEGTIVAGNPAVVVGKFTDLQEKRRKIDTNKNDMTFMNRYEEIWEFFYSTKNRK